MWGMRTWLLVAFCGCHPATTPDAPMSPLPPALVDKPAAPMDAALASKGAPSIESLGWEAFPVIPPAPVSQPTGAPISVPFTLPKVGDVEQHVMSSVFIQHYVYDGGTRYQKTDTDFELTLKVLDVANDHPSKLEVTANKAVETVELSSAPTGVPTQSELLLMGTYIITAGKGGGFQRDEGNVSRPSGSRVQGREQEELGSLFGEMLRDGNATARYVKNKHLRLGEVITLDAEAKRMLGGGDDPTPEIFTLAVTKADAKSVTYEFDVVTKEPFHRSAETTVEGRVRHTLTFELPSGRLREVVEVVHKTERYKDTVDDTYARHSLVIK
jgi:hypothetical protein